MGSCSFQIGDAAKLPFPDDHFDLVFCSPPYEAQREYEELEFDLTGDDWVQWCADCYMESLRVCKGLVCYVVEGFTKDFEYSCSPMELLVEIKRRGAKVRKPPIYKRRGVPGSGSVDYLRNDYELIVTATKNGRLPWADNSAMGKRPATNRRRMTTNRRKDGTRKQSLYKDPERSNPGNIIRCEVGNGGFKWRDATKNEAPFSEYLAEFFVRSFCPPEGWVLDPFSGSGTTAVVARRLGRNGIGIDKRESQIYLAETRAMGLTLEQRRQGQQTFAIYD